ncbi:GldG family protein [Frateuria aurantia]
MKGWTERGHRRRWLWLGLVLLLPAYLGLLAISNLTLRNVRIDLTHDGLYTLTPGTVGIVSQLHHPIRLTLYFSAHATSDAPQLRSYEQRVVDMLREMAARSHNRLRLKVIDPMPYSDDEVTAESYGLAPLSGGGNGEQLFMGLVATAMTGDSRSDEGRAGRVLTIPLLDPSRESFLEYDVAKLLYELNAPNRPTLGIYSTLPIDGNPVLGDAPWTLLTQLRQLFDVKLLDHQQLAHLSTRTHVLLLIHPKRLTDEELEGLDQYVLEGGHLVVFVDPYSEVDNAPYVDSNGLIDDHSSNLPRLFHAWGVQYDPGRVVLDRSLALPIELADNTRVSHPAMLGLGSGQINHHDVITASLQRVNVSSSGYFDLLPGTTSRLIPLLQTSGDAESLPVERVIEGVSDPAGLLDGYHPDDNHYVVAARIQGITHSAFPEHASVLGHLQQAGTPREVIVVADTDLLTDRLWLRYTQSLLGQPQLSALANNGDLIANMADYLSGSSSLLSIHGRTTGQRHFTRVQALQRAADQKFLMKKQELQHELVETRRRLAELQPVKGGQDNGLSSDQKLEVEQFLHRQLAINEELREVQHHLNAEIDALGRRLKLINIALMPALVALFGLIFAWRRTRQRRSRRPG